MCFRISVVVLFLSISSLPALAQDSDRYLALSMTDVTIENALDTLSELSGYNFSYNSSIFPEGSLYTFNYEGFTLSQILSEIFSGLDVEYEFDSGDQIILRKIKPRRASVRNYFSISGFARELDTEEAIPGVSVYLDGTTIGTTTDESGRYLLERVPFGSYRIIFSHLSYENKVFEFSRSTGNEFFANAEMELATNLLEHVEVTADLDRRERKSRSKLVLDFKNQFIGTSAFSAECVFINPDVLNFEYNKNYEALYASANEPLIIQNNALGYNLYCDLNEFFSTETSVRFTGMVRFEELTPTDIKQQRNWSAKREESYKGSVQHFFKSLIDGNYRKEGFRVYFLEELSDLSDLRNEASRVGNILKETGVPYRWEINLKKILYVIYLKELESSAYLYDMEKEFRADVSNPNKLLFIKRKPQNQRSLIQLSEGPVYVDLNGRVLNPEGLTISGYWSWERMADLVPTNYAPEP